MHDLTTDGANYHAYQTIHTIAGLGLGETLMPVLVSANVLNHLTLV